MAWEPTGPEQEQQQGQPLLEVGVSLSDLRLLLRALESATNVSQAQDLVSQFRNLDQNPKPSKLTRVLDSARRRVQGYIAEATKAPELEEGQDYEDNDGFVA